MIAKPDTRALLALRRGDWVRRERMRRGAWALIDYVRIRHVTEKTLFVGDGRKRSDGFDRYTGRARITWAAVRILPVDIPELQNEEAWREYAK